MLSASTEVTVPSIARPPSETNPRGPPAPGAKLPSVRTIGPCVKSPTPGNALAGTVDRPTANATPPIARIVAPIRSRLRRPPDFARGAIAPTGATGATGVLGAGAGLGIGATGWLGSVVIEGSPSLGAQGADGGRAGRRAGGPDAEDDADQEAEHDGRDERGGMECEAPAGDLADEGRDAKAHGDADQPAEQRQGQCLDEELGEDVAAARTDGLADADLAGPLADGHQHDVHDPDAAHDQRDGCDPAQQEGQRAT